jgi:hypothetical protein
MTFPRLRRLAWLGVLLATLPAAHARAGEPSREVEEDPFAFFRSTIELSDSQRERLARGQVVTEMLPADGLQVGFFGAVAVKARAPVLLDLLHRIGDFREGPRVLETREFSNPPQLADLDRLALPDQDLDELRRCEPEDCDLKLTDREIRRIQGVVRRSGDDWRAELQREFRKLVLERTRTYLTSGHTRTPPLQSSSEPIDLDVRVSELLRKMPTLTAQLPALTAYLEHYPDVPLPRGAESFLYWTVEDLRRPVVVVRHVVTLRGQSGSRQPLVISVSKQVLATHYLDASIGVTCLIRGEPGSPHNYFVYLNRSALDFLDGFPAWLRRRLVSRGVESEGAKLLLYIRDRIERRARRLEVNDQARY